MGRNVPEEQQQHWARTFTESAVQALDRLAFASGAGYLREGLDDCNYDWRLRCIPDLGRMVTASRSPVSKRSPLNPPAAGVILSPP